MKKLNEEGWLDLSDEPHYFPHLATWDPRVLTERLIASLQADGKEVNYHNLRGFAAIMESDLEEMFGIQTPRKAKKQVKAPRRKTK